MERGYGFNKEGVPPYNSNVFTPGEQEKTGKLDQAIFEATFQEEPRPMQDEQSPLHGLRDNLTNIVISGSAIASVALVLSGGEVQRMIGFCGMIAAGSISHLKTPFRF